MSTTRTFNRHKTKYIVFSEPDLHKKLADDISKVLKKSNLLEKYHFFVIRIEAKKKENYE